MRVFIALGAALLFWSAPAHAVVVVCADGTTVGPVFLNDDPCAGHGGPSQGGTERTGDDCGPIGAVICPGHGRLLKPPSTPSGKTDTNTTSNTTVTENFPVLFHFPDYAHCVSTLDDKTVASVVLPGNTSVTDYCKRLYPEQLTGVENVTLEMSFTLTAGDCESELNNGDGGTVQLPAGDTTQSTCERLFPTTVATTSVPPPSSPVTPEVDKF
jgi:hypothetical protein